MYEPAITVSLVSKVTTAPAVATLSSINKVYHHYTCSDHVADKTRPIHTAVSEKSARDNPER